MLRQALRHVEIGREIALLVRMVLRPGPGRTAAASSLNRQTLVESATSNSLGLAPTIGASLAAIRVGQSIQPWLVPAGDQVLAPLALGRRAQTAAVAERQRAERIAVEIDDALRQREPLAREGKRVAASSSRASSAGSWSGGAMPVLKLQVPRFRARPAEGQEMAMAHKFVIKETHGGGIGPIKIQ